MFYAKIDMNFRQTDKNPRLYKYFISLDKPYLKNVFKGKDAIKQQ